MMIPKNQLSIYHRAFKAYLKELENAEADRKLRDSLAAGRVEYKAYLKELEKAEDDPKLRESILAGHTDKVSRFVVLEIGQQINLLCLQDLFLRKNCHCLTVFLLCAP